MAGRPMRSRFLTATPVEEHGLLFPALWIGLSSDAAPSSPVVTETVGIADSTARVHATERIVADTMGITDNVSYQKTTDGEETLTDSVGVTDVVSYDHVTAGGGGWGMLPI